MTLGLAPEVLNPVDVIDVLGEQFRVVDPNVMELGNIQNIIGTETVGVDDGVRSHLILDDWEKRVCTGIWDDNDMNLATSFQEPEDRNLARCATPTLTFPASAEIAFIDFDLAAHQARF